MSDDFKVQLNIKKGQDLLNIRASNADEFKSLYGELTDMPALSRFFPNPTPAAVQLAPQTLAGTPVDAEEQGGPASVEEFLAGAEDSTTVSLPEQQSTPLTPLEKARLRMKGAA